MHVVEHQHDRGEPPQQRPDRARDGVALDGRGRVAAERRPCGRQRRRERHELVP
ncbi:MAG TPA: hypothetical protein VFZ00_05930 [Solirubrobacter sp.]|nr:hypothetical protein [Solirubrobacter sp.]